MNIRTFSILCVFIFLFAFSPYSSADTAPDYSVDEMCNMADIIVEGTYLNGDKVKVEQVYKAPEGIKMEGEIINVEQLGKHNRKSGFDPNENSPEISTKNLVLFLIYSKEDKKLRPISTVEEMKVLGSCGVFWFDEKACYGYEQLMNPGPYYLVSAKENEYSRVPKTIKHMRIEIKTGLENSKRWKETIAIADPKKKAEALSKYLLKWTAPEGDKGSYRREIREQMGALKADAVPSMVDVLKKAKPDDKLDEVVLIIYDIGTPARDTVLYLCELLSSPKQVYTGYVLGALKTIEDPTAIPKVRPLLKSEDFQISIKAALALCAMKDTDSFDEMAALVPEEPRKEDADILSDLLKALYDLDNIRGKEIIGKTANHPNMELKQRDLFDYMIKKQ